MLCPLGALLVTAAMIHDGDTVVLPGPNARLADFDTPEIEKAECIEERIAGVAARDTLKEMMPGCLVILPGSGGYGRQLGVLYTGDADVGDQLSADGLAIWARNVKWCRQMGRTGF